MYCHILYISTTMSTVLKGSGKASCTELYVVSFSILTYNDYVLQRCVTTLGIIILQFALCMHLLYIVIYIEWIYCYMS